MTTNNKLFSIKSVKSIKKLVENRWLNQHTTNVDSLPKAHIGLWIALAAGLGLFAELMMIRVHSSYFQLFAYLKNVSLLSCFLGLGVGYARGKKRPLYTPFVLPLLALQIVIMYFLRSSSISELLQNPISEQLSLGLLQTNSSYKDMFIFGFVVSVFVFNALAFVPLGQLASRLMARQKALTAYSWNLIGSLLGIVLFSFLSFIWSPPLVWFLVAAVLFLLLIHKNMLSIIISGVSVAIVVVVLSLSPQLNRYDIFSPYQILTLTFSRNAPPIILTSNAYYQKILDLRPDSIANNAALESSNEYYSIPYSFKPKPKDVLVVGSGTGNDVAAALRSGAGKIDAVEIDPAIMQAGKELHPEAPYHSPRVNPVVNDARPFIRYTDKQYDLIVYGLLDSHTLLSGRGGIRLDSYVYTVEAFKEARTKLKKDGAISLTFALLSHELGRKLFLMLEEAFDGQSPIVYYSQYDGGYTFLAGDNITNTKVDTSFEDVTAFFKEGGMKADKSTDDWPFFYMPVRKYPISSITLIFILLVVSLFFIKKFVAKTGSGISIPAFFLGAGFMLLETKGVTELALNYGSTWYVISIIIVSILLMGFLANLYVMKRGTPRRNLVYILLFVSMLVSFGFTYIKFFDYSPLLSKIIMPISLTIPLFFSGMAFSSELKRFSNVGVVLYSNLLGAMLGGFLEYNSMYFGFRSLYFFALVMYIFAFLGTFKLASLKQK